MNKAFTISSKFTKHPIVEKAYEDLKQAILSNALKPGTPLSENQLASSLGISRTPVRAVFQKLERDGLVEIIPYKGAFVSRITATDVIEIYQMREALEGLATRLAAERASADSLARIWEQYQTLANSKTTQTLETLDEAGWALHDFVIQAANNRRLLNSVKTLWNQIIRIRSFAYAEGEDADRFFKEHLQIIEALNERDGVRASQTMKDHLLSAQEIVLKNLLKIGESSVIQT